FDLLKFLIENKKNTRFHFEISGWILDDEVIKLINSAPYGLFQFEIGIQSTNQDTLDTVYRKADTGILFKNIKRLIQKGNAHIHLDLIAGLPKENISSFRMSFNDAFNLKPDMLQLGFLKLLKGSALRENAREYGIVYESYPPYEVLKTDAISFKELICLKNIADMVDAYYNSGRFDTILSYIVGAFGTPFDFFSKFAEYRSKKISMNIKIGNVQQYELIYDFCRGNGDININLAKECLAFDYLMQGRNTYMPDFIRPDVSVDKQYIWNFLSDRHNIEKYLPYYAGTSTKEIIKSICVKYFKYNIFKFVRHPAFNAEDCIVFFDYGHKDRYGRVKYFPVQK
ncbi:MAG TPA: B12-binding domain-containing radical SAM protein, partial [Clostridiaceae bacterium]|nr:B12-binding domain-containing radical SAM protein [Clostridiaceae bacterium]